MMMLTDENKPLDTDLISQECHYFVLKMKNSDNPDFYCNHLTQIEQFLASSVSLQIGPFSLIMPLHWSILCSDMEYVQTIPLYEINGRDYRSFCLNPIDGFVPNYLKIRQRDIYKNTTWTCPILDDKDMLVVPLGKIDRPNSGHKSVERGPICAIFSPSRMDVTKPISDIW